MNRQEREKLKRNLFVGVDFIGDEEIRVNHELKARSKMQLILQKINQLIEYLTPLRVDVL